MTMGQRLEKLCKVAPLALGGLFVGSGVLHFVAPKPFEAIMPRQLPAHREFVYGSGAAELACGLGLLTRQKWAGPASAALLLAVWPANVQMALDSGSGRLPSVADNKLVAWGRVPLQVPLIWAALQSRPRAGTAQD
ncbi:DoxX family protein [Nocardiopsis metallicus]|uniref:Putative membrane protein n=1 Tax=Nocardiopsis metallicus TaxID=179819 RepID=A0A840WQK0_9ACTN|nr:DoxX family protein [Nocardiopsis metallicus]MBB5494125.1 putative membrane protein [Nocardiopsis metallicus]